MAVNDVSDDRGSVTMGAPVLLIVENDTAFARFLLDAAREQGFKGIVTSLGVSALALANEFQPAAVTLDIFLPDISGWRVLDRLKHDPLTRHIPVAVISTDESRERALDNGAYAFLEKPIQSKETLDRLLACVKHFVQRHDKTVLAVSSDPERLAWLGPYLKADDLTVITADRGGKRARGTGSAGDRLRGMGCESPASGRWKARNRSRRRLPQSNACRSSCMAGDVERTRRGRLGPAFPQRGRARGARAGAPARAGEFVLASIHLQTCRSRTGRRCGASPKPTKCLRASGR